MDAIVLAGGKLTADDHPSALAPGGHKCLVELSGKPMVQWALDALSTARTVDRVVVVGLPAGAELDCARPLTVLAGEPDMIASVHLAAEWLLRDRPDAGHALLVSADAPLITGEMIDWLASRVCAQGDDVNLCVVERSVMEARFPGSKRTYVQLKDVEVCGGDLSAVRLSVTGRAQEIGRRIAEARKQPWRQALLIGPGTLVALLRRRLTLAQAEQAISKRFDIEARAILSPFAEVAMDVDKPAQLEIVRAALADRG